MIATGNIYFTQGKFTVYEIGDTYCTDPPPPAWGNAVTMHMMSIYNAAGKNVINSGPIIGTGGNSSVVSIAQSKIGCAYAWGSHGPNTFDCSGFVEWCYRQNGINVPWSTSAYSGYVGTSNEVGWTNVQPRRHFDNIWLGKKYTFRACWNIYWK